jgi:hypothetical protein
MLEELSGWVMGIEIVGTVGIVVELSAGGGEKLGTGCTVGMNDGRGTVIVVVLTAGAVGRGILEELSGCVMGIEIVGNVIGSDGKETVTPVDVDMLADGIGIPAEGVRVGREIVGGSKIVVLLGGTGMIVGVGSGEREGIPVGSGLLDGRTGGGGSTEKPMDVVGSWGIVEGIPGGRLHVMFCAAAKPHRLRARSVPSMNILTRCSRNVEGTRRVSYSLYVLFPQRRCFIPLTGSPQTADQPTIEHPWPV